MMRYGWVVSVGVLLGSGLNALALEVAPIALSGQSAPGTSATFSSFSGGGFVNASGQVAFRASLAGPGVTGSNASGIWTTSPSTLRLVSRTGDAPAPGTIYPYASNHIRRIDTTGKVIQWGLLDTLNFPGALAMDDGGTPSLIVGQGVSAPGIGGGATFGGATMTSVSLSGQMAIQGYLEGPGVTVNNRNGLWTGIPGQLDFVLRQGDPATPFGPGVVHEDILDLGSPNSSAQAVFRTQLAGAGVSVFTDQALWLASPQPILIAREDDPAPGAGGDVRYAGFTPGSLNDSGEVAFYASLRNTSGGSSSSSGLFSGPAASPTLFVKAGTIAPDAGSGETFTQFDSPQIDSAGKVAFRAETTGGEGLWLGDTGSLNGVAITGQLVPEAGGATFGPLTSWGPTDASGQLLLSTQLLGPVNSSNDQALFVANMTGELQMLLREGDLITVGPGDVRTVSTFLAGELSGERFALRISFTDGSSGVFLAEVPEPSVLPVLLGLALQRRKRDEPR